METFTIIRHAMYNNTTGDIFNPNEFEDISEAFSRVAQDYDLIVHSPTKRAVQTAKIIQEMKNIPLLEAEELRDEEFITSYQIENLEEKVEAKNPLLISHLPIIKDMLSYYQDKIHAKKDPDWSFYNLEGFHVNSYEGQITKVPNNTIISDVSMYLPHLPIYNEVNYRNTLEDLQRTLTTFDDKKTKDNLKLLDLLSFSEDYGNSYRGILKLINQINNFEVLAKDFKEREVREFTQEDAQNLIYLQEQNKIDSYLQSDRKLELYVDQVREEDPDYDDLPF